MQHKSLRTTYSRQATINTNCSKRERHQTLAAKTRSPTVTVIVTLADCTPSLALSTNVAVPTKPAAGTNTAVPSVVLTTTWPCAAPGCVATPSVRPAPLGEVNRGELPPRALMTRGVSWAAV